MRALADKDKTLTSPAAIDLARRALEEAAGGAESSVGEHLAATVEEQRLITHLFACTMPGYRGWRWAATLSRPPRGRTATVCEIGLLPGEEALLAPAWVPWADRLEPGDLTRSDRLPKREEDERLEPGWEATGKDADAVALDELDLGRARVLSAEGVSRAAQRWYEGDHGPEADGVRAAHATCSTCGFFLPMAGVLRAVFGVCANGWATDDGSVVSLDHGCGAHSETDVPDQGPQWPIAAARVDDHAVEPLSTDGRSLRRGTALVAPGQAGEGTGQYPEQDAGREAGSAKTGEERAEQAEAQGEAIAPSTAPAPSSTKAPRARRRRRATSQAVDPGNRRAERRQAPQTTQAAQGTGAPASPQGRARAASPVIEPLLQITRPSATSPVAAEPVAGQAVLGGAGAPEDDGDQQPESASTSRPGASQKEGAEEPEDRAASAREAVADLAHSARPAAEAQTAGPMSLADLEAVLPQR